MEIKLKVIAHDQQPYQEDLSACFGDAGGSIGRSKLNTLVLPDQFGYVSRVHANIIMQGEQFSIVDCSSNGTFLFDVEPMSQQHAGEIVLQNSAAMLNIGSHINIGGFEIEVQAVQQPVAQVITQENAIPAHANPVFVVPDVEEKPTLEQPQDDYEFEALIGIPPVAESFTPPSVNQPVANIKSGSEEPDQLAIDDFFSGPASPAQSNDSPEAQLTPSQSSQATFAIAPEPSEKEILEPVTKATASDGENAATLFFNSLGLQPAQYPVDTEQALTTAGEMFRTLLTGTMALMQGRTEIKRQMSAQLTSLQKEENNPLKFCENVDELLPYLFSQNTPGFVPPLQATEDCQAQLLEHQIAMMAGIQAGLQMAIDKFNPAVIENSLNDARFNKPAKCWEQFTLSYLETAKQVEDEFFGDSFRHAYEQQIEQIKNTK